MEPILRFIHEKEMKGCSWVSIKKKRLYEPDKRLFRTQYDLICDFEDIQPIEKNAIAPFRIVSWDIEADSSHGDFPLAKKDYTKLSKEIVDIYITTFRNKSFKDIDIAKWAFYQLLTTFSLNKENLEKQITELEAKNDKQLNVILKWIDSYQPASNSVSLIYTKKNKKPKLEKIINSLETMIDYLKKMKVQDDSNEYVKKYKKLVIKKLIELFNTTFPDVEGDHIIQISNIIQHYNQPEIKEIIFVVGGCSKIEGAKVYSFETEEELLLAWKDFIQQYDPDILIGYNIFGFDYDFMYNRALELEIEDEFMDIGRRLYDDGNPSATFESKKLSSSAMGDNILKLIDMYGRISIDLYKVFQTDVTNKLDSYKLDSVAEIFLGENKDDVSPQEIFKLQKGSNDDRCTIAKYCLQDARLVLRLLNKKKIILNNVGMANVCLIPFSYLFMRGQGVKIYSLVGNECMKKNYLIPLTKKKKTAAKKETAATSTEIEEFSESEDEMVEEPENQPDSESESPEDEEKKEDSDDEQEESYEGAIVLPPKPNIYLKNGVGVCDFNSLYPNSMRRRNICHTAIISIRTFDDSGKLIRREDEMGEYDFSKSPKDDAEFGITELEKSIFDGKMEGYTFIDVKYDNFRYMTAYMANGKKKKNKEKTKFGYVLCRYVQFPGGKKGIIPDIEEKLLNARKTTRVKAEYKTVETGTEKYSGLWLNKKSAEKDGFYQLKTETQGEVKIPISEFKTIYDTYDEFEQAILDSLQLAYKIVANSLYGQVGASTSPICWKVLAASTTATGRDCLQFSKEHIESHYKYKDNIEVEVPYFNGTDFECNKKIKKKVIVKDANIVYGDSVMPYTPVVIRKNGDCFIKRIDELTKTYDSFNVPNKENKEQHLFDENIEIWTQNGWSKIIRVIRHKCHKKIYRITSPHGQIDTTEDHSLLDENLNLLKPTEITSETQLLHGLPDISDYNLYVDNSHFVMNDDVYQQYLYLVYPESRRTIKETKSELLYSDYDGYVYDLETMEGVFHAGVGSLIVKNTDSVFYALTVLDQETGKEIWGKEAIPIMMQMGARFGKEITVQLGAPQNLAFEKYIYPFILFTKKRYMGYYHENMDNPNDSHEKSMGILLKRRDFAPITKHVFKSITDYILQKKDIEGSKQLLDEMLSKLIKGEFPIDMFILSKTLKDRSGYSNPDQIAHRVLADRMIERDPGNKPQSNDRLPFCYVKVPEVDDKGKKIKVLNGNRIEHPDYILKNSLEIDYKYYLTNQIRNGIEQLYGLVMENPKILFEKFIEKKIKKSILVDKNDVLVKPTLPKTIKQEKPEKTIDKNLIIEKLGGNLKKLTDKLDKCSKTDLELIAIYYEVDITKAGKKGKIYKLKNELIDDIKKKI